MMYSCLPLQSFVYFSLKIAIEAESPGSGAVFSQKNFAEIETAPIAQLDRASDFESEGWGFDSLWVHYNVRSRIPKTVS